MSYLIKSWKQVNWSPPLHSSIEVTATSYFRPTDAAHDVTSSGSLTPISSDGYDSDTPLPQHKVQICPTRVKNFMKRVRSIRPLDLVTKAAGSRLIFLATLAILLVWAIIGAVLGPSDVWQIVMQNASSIQCYV
jgi:low-affinity ferrous iron transport protein